VSVSGELVCSKCQWSGAPERAIRWKQPFDTKSGDDEWHLRADCPSCGTFLRYLPKGDLARGPATPNLDRLIVMLGHLALTDLAAELDTWAERQLPRLDKLES
jgi:hypothetical protein